MFQVIRPRTVMLEQERFSIQKRNLNPLFAQVVMLSKNLEKVMHWITEREEQRQAESLVGMVSNVGPKKAMSRKQMNVTGTNDSHSILRRE